ncbi:MAG: hypothetical protein ABL901_00985 [Hyphomicrobiaceae bacterium]
MHLLIYVLAAVQAMSARSYFGGNWWPASGDEVIADALTLLICAIGVLAGIIERKATP